MTTSQFLYKLTTSQFTFLPKHPASEVQDVLAEMCNGAMFTGLDWISDVEKVITDRHGVSVGMEKMLK